MPSSRYIQQLNVPPADVKSFVIRSFNGGFNNVSEPRSNQAYNILNMKFSDTNLMEKRTGLKNTGLVTVVPTNAKITFIDEYKPYVGANKLVVATDINIYIDNVLLTEVAGRVHGTTFNNEYWFVDGTNIWVYDGTSVKKLKTPPSGFTPAPSPATIGVWKSDATHRWYEPCKAEIDDSYKGANVVPTGPKYICARKQRLYLAGCSTDVNNVFISDVQNAFYFPVSLPLSYNPNGEKITGLKEFMDVMIVGREESVWGIYGNSNRLDSDDLFKAKQISTHAGIFSQESMQLMNNYMTFLGNDGVVYRMSTPSSDVKLLTTQIMSVDVDIENFPFFYKPKDMTNISALFFNGEYYIRINDRIFVYNYRYMAWTVFDSLDANYMFNLNGLMVIGDSKGRLLRFKNYYQYIDENTPADVVAESQIAYSDYESTEKKAITAFWQIKRLDMDIPAYYKFFRDIYVVTQTYRTINAYLNMVFEVDYDDVQSSFRINNRVSMFNIAQFGDKFISKDITQSIPTRIGRRGRYLSIKIENNDVDGPLKIHEISADYTIRGRR